MHWKQIAHAQAMQPVKPEPTIVEQQHNIEGDLSRLNYLAPGKTTLSQLLLIYTSSTYANREAQTRSFSRFKNRS